MQHQHSIESDDVSRPLPDRTEAERFIEALTGSKETPVVFQTFVEPKGAYPLIKPHKWLGTLADSWDRIDNLNLCGCGVFVQVNDGLDRGKEHVTGIRALFIDDDSGGIDPTTVSVTPTVTVKTVHGSHTYWRVKAGEPLDIFEQAQKRLAAAYNSDPAVSNLDRVMRLPGTLHLKDRTNPTLVTTVQIAPVAYTVAEILKAHGQTTTTTPPRSSTTTATPLPPAVDADQAVSRAGAYLDAVEGVEEGKRNHTAYRLAATVVRDFAVPTHLATALLHTRWNCRNLPPLPEEELEEVVKSAHRTGREPVGSKLTVTLPEAKPSPVEPGRTASEGSTQIANAKRLGRRAHEEGFRYVTDPNWKCWIAFDGKRYVRDHGKIQELAITVLNDLLIEAYACEDHTEKVSLVKAALSYQKRAYVDDVIALAPSVFPEVKIPASKLDADPWVLNCTNGTLDLRTGKIRPHDPADLITKLAGASYSRDTKSQLWEQTVAQVLPDADAARFLQKFMGYCLTGSTQEEKLLFAQGGGRNGKGTLIETIKDAVGEYAGAAPESLLIAKRFESHPTELAMLKGLRLVLATEVGKNRSWNSARVKFLTGSDTVSARGMRQDFFDFRPTHKLVVQSNPRPRADPGDHAIWERMKLLPFEQEFRDPADTRPDRQHLPPRNTHLKGQLARQLDGVLTWLVDGCLAWQAEGLGEPSKVVEATQEYRQEQLELDPITNFMAQREIPKEGIPLQALVVEYNASQKHEMSQVSAKELKGALESMGYVVAKTSRGTIKNANFVFPKPITITVTSNEGGMNGTSADR